MFQGQKAGHGGGTAGKPKAARYEVTAAAAGPSLSGHAVGARAMLSPSRAGLKEAPDGAPPPDSSSKGGEWVKALTGKRKVPGTSPPLPKGGWRLSGNSKNGGNPRRAGCAHHQSMRTYTVFWVDTAHPTRVIGSFPASGRYPWPLQSTGRTLMGGNVKAIIMGPGYRIAH